MAPHVQNGIPTHAFIKILILIKIESVAMKVIWILRQPTLEAHLLRKMSYFVENLKNKLELQKPFEEHVQSIFLQLDIERK